MAIAAVTAGNVIDPTTFGNAVVDVLNGIQSGAVTDTSDGNGRISVTFPSAYSTAPVVVATRLSTATTQLVAQIYSVSATEVVFSCTADDALQTSISNIVIHWVAIGTLA